MTGIVVGVDGSATGDRALDWALHEAIRRDSELTVAHVWDVSDVPAFAMSAAIAEGVDEAAHQLVQQSLDRAYARDPQLKAVTVHTVVVEDRPAKALVRLAKDAPLLVVGSHGASGVKAAVLGSVSSACIHHATSPVAVIPGAGPVADSSEVHRVIAGCDGSPASMAALHWAASAARSRGWPLVVVYAWQIPFVPSPVGFAPYVPPIDAFEDSAKEVLSDAVKRAGLAEDVEQVTVHGTAVRTLLDLARPSDLLVIGSRGHGGFLGLLLGSVSSQVVNHATCPTVVVHAGEELLAS